MKTAHALTLTLLLALLCGSLRAEGDSGNPFSGYPEEEGTGRTLKPKTKKKPRPIVREEPEETEPDREPDSVDDAESDRNDKIEEAVTRPSKKEPITIWVAIYGGISFMNIASDGLDSQRTQEGLNMTYPFGVQANIHAMRYWGGEIEGYYSLAPSQSVLPDGGGTEVSKTLKPYGFMIVAKGMYPFDHMGPVKWTPSLGLGFGWSHLSYSASALTASDTTDLQSSGALAFLGVEVVPSKQLRFSADIALSLAAPGQLTQTGGQVSGTGSFSRIRVAGYYQITKEIAAGLVLIRRSLSASFATAPAAPASVGGVPSTAPTGAMEAQNQLMVTGTYTF